MSSTTAFGGDDDDDSDGGDGSGESFCFPNAAIAAVVLVVVVVAVVAEADAAPRLKVIHTSVVFKTFLLKHDINVRRLCPSRLLFLSSTMSHDIGPSSLL